MISKTIEDMSAFEMARWFSLIESISLISTECEERGINFNKIKISPLNIEKYVEGTCDAFARKIEEEREIEEERNKENNKHQVILAMTSNTPEQITNDIYNRI
jgi:hypothetical protein